MSAIKDASKSETWKMFDVISHKYDLLNKVLSFGIDRWWRYRLGYYLPPSKTPLTVLDIATGTGDVGLSLLKHHRKKIKTVIGVDLAKDMLSRAEQKIKKKKVADMIVTVGDATSLPITSESIEATTMAFGIRNVPDVPKAISEMHRVLKPNGRALIMEFSLPSFFLLRWGYLAYFRCVLPAIGGIISGNKKAYTYLNKSVEAFPAGKEFESLMINAGFSSVKSFRLTFGVVSIYQGDK
jgi:demethylmenaquinone methyltransferase/2-methoxy-6-polyprenyl-1,4-benzoquinol methylase